jgi:hypothetical protein
MLINKNSKNKIKKIKGCASYTHEMKKTREDSDKYLLV